MEKDLILDNFKNFIEGKLSPHQYHAWLNMYRPDVSSVFGEKTLRNLTIDDYYLTPDGETGLYHRSFQVMYAIRAILHEHSIQFSEDTLHFYEAEANRIRQEIKPLTDFGFKINDTLVKTYKCEIGGSKSGVFVKRMFKKYQDAGSPRSVLKWIEENVMPEFVCLTTKPIWHDKKGVISWPMGYHNENPAVFLGQFDVPEQNVYEDRFISGITVYVFGFKSPEECGGFRVEYITFDHTTNDTSQSIEEHYKDEEKRMKKEKTKKMKKE